MAKTAAAWGIDIGQCALKAIRCRIDDKNPGKIVADAFDLIEYPKILTQPEADPVELVREALEKFLTRNELRKAKVAVSVSGQSGLARFIKLPPVETKKIPDIVHYEANQQIPFDLDDVIWDYQRMFGGSEEEGFALETEVGLFAMKRDQVFQEIEPYIEAAVDLDVVQLAPLALYNYVVFDQLGKLPSESEFDPEDPPESVVVLSIGTESTDLVITNGFRVWQRSVPLGGSHFTKALVKELQLTYAKAEHLKRNASHAEDPKALYQAMRPVFKDLLTEIQRSIGYFHSIDRAAKIGRIVALGNSIKLPGLKRYLAQNLDTKVDEIQTMPTLTGSAVTQSPAFKENLLGFGVPYGLALQALGVGRLSTNLVPREIVRDRIINRKKPWAVAASVLLALGCLINFLILWWPWSQVRIGDPGWESATESGKAISATVEKNKSSYRAADQKFRDEVQRGEQRVKHVSGRLDWSNLSAAIYACLPNEELADVPLPAGTDLRQHRTNLWRHRKTIWVTDLRPQEMRDNVGKWFTSAGIAAKYQENSKPVQITLDVAVDDGGIDFDPEQETEKILAPLTPQFPATGPPSGPGWVVQIMGFHFHDSEKHGKSANFVRRTLVHNLQDKIVKVPDDQGNLVDVSVRDLGISYPVVYEELDTKTVEITDDATGDGKPLELKQYRFVVQFAWTPGKVRPAEPPQVAQAGK